MNSPNAPIFLGETTIELVIRGSTVIACARPVLRFLPSSNTAIEFEAPYSNWASLDDVETTISLVEHDVNIEIVVTSLNFKENSVSGVLVSRQEPFTISNNVDQHIVSINFSVLNFPKFFGSQEQILNTDSGGIRRLGSAQLKSDNWLVEFSEVPNLKQLEEELRAEGGYIFTHTGTITRSDANSFSIDEAEHILDGLTLFSSFARGAFCSMAFPSGVNRIGTKIWEKWGTGSVTPWGYTPSWFDRMHGQHLAEVFPGFWDKFNDPTWSNTIREVLYWYLRNNSHGSGAGVDGGLILTQAALERLSYILLNYSKSGNAASRIRDSLSSLGIEIKIPSSCKELQSLAKERNWKDGPHALTAVRNNLIHPKQSFERPSSTQYYEAWNLGQNYIELMLLKLFCHKGDYGNRLAQKWRGEVEPVPWA